MGGRFGGWRLLERLQRQIARAEALDVFQLAVELGEVAFFVANEPLEDLLGGGVGARGALQGGLVIGVRAGFLHLAGLGQHGGGIGNLLNRGGQGHFDVALPSANICQPSTWLRLSLNSSRTISCNSSASVGMNSLQCLTLEEGWYFGRSARGFIVTMPRLFE